MSFFMLNNNFRAKFISKIILVIKRYIRVVIGKYGNAFGEMRFYFCGCINTPMQEIGRKRLLFKLMFCFGLEYTICSNQTKEHSVQVQQRR
ncbi:MAG: hypothetical protein A3B96_03255 [Candidatus Spechtbacteria bacterium RIFCSPHIGHO2_02_FULL_43_15b]|uniref:Uncharacterized protein n=1 Tax=Candidatus Spechtbacteria bacterium RIFCSPHIGHO2_01_FULL_43_30 TaxID=1802158 RepID=A0A1G2H8Z3_9BACT|nr:MAG: hypothetical protein A2827_00395 [Candidatus Spechtbacteria bacterium RIFCSPHIGHO2_01_FULL_43_30]OGZ59760.1 MAG: hypothetical protein A3B96_03255 [Candidatus Spechtbacteria bacterium RIFCSPHIGHO2_02_FULL_43_15b]